VSTRKPELNNPKKRGHLYPLSKGKGENKEGLVFPPKNRHNVIFQTSPVTFLSTQNYPSLTKPRLERNFH
jgi:hypothetical protein